jgi:hypothetical protein
MHFPHNKNLMQLFQHESNKKILIMDELLIYSQILKKNLVLYCPLELTLQMHAMIISLYLWGLRLRNPVVLCYGPPNII